MAADLGASEIRRTFSPGSPNNHMSGAKAAIGSSTVNRRVPAKSYA
jgi:hypothetical protein